MLLFILLLLLKLLLLLLLLLVLVLLLLLMFPLPPPCCPGCKYSGDWGDCDPFKMIKIKEQRLITGGTECQVQEDLQKL